MLGGQIWFQCRERLHEDFYPQFALKEAEKRTPDRFQCRERLHEDFYSSWITRCQGLTEPRARFSAANGYMRFPTNTLAEGEGSRA